MDVRMQILIRNVERINYMVLPDVGCGLHTSGPAHHLCDALTTQHKFGGIW